MKSHWQWIGSAPGRVEWLGNHTDYNDGVVLGAGLDVGTTVRAREASGSRLIMHAEDLGETHEARLEDLHPAAPGSWANYVIGVAAEFIARGATASGIELSITSTVPMGSGLSSSAALEAATARTFQQAWRTKFDDLELARIGQEAEHKFAGVRCGLLDQIVSLFAAEQSAIFLDCRTLEVQRVPVPAEARFVIIPSGVRHALSDGAYNTRRTECEEAARILGMSKLRDASPEMLREAELSGRLSGVLLRRAQHIVGENTRVPAAVEALRKGDLARVGRLMNESHESSRTLFENSCEELDFLAAESRKISGCLGARLTGGGFGGAVLALARAGSEEQFAHAMSARTAQHLNFSPQILITAPGGGNRGGKQ